MAVAIPLMNALLILNDAAGPHGAEKDAVTPAILTDAFAAAGIRVQTRIAPPVQLCDVLTVAVAERPDAIFVGGGDGSISAAAGRLVDTRIPLGVLPLGTLNHFARDIGLPQSWRDAVVALAGGEPRPLDVGEVNGRIFVNNCSLGSYADAVRKRDALRRIHGSGKWWAMTVATFAVFRNLRRLRVRLETNGQTLALRSPFVVVSNNRYSGHVLDYSLRPRLDEGRLWIYSTRAKQRLAILGLIWQSLFRQIDRVDGLDAFEIVDAVITRDQGPVPIAVDGELVELKPPLHFRSRPGALQVIVPTTAKTKP